MLGLSRASRTWNARRSINLAWYLGASQSDLTCLDAENLDWEQRVISFARMKTGSVALLRFGDEVAVSCAAYRRPVRCSRICARCAVATARPSSNSVVSDLAFAAFRCLRTGTLWR